MYLDHFGLLEPPFRITPHTDFFFSGANRGATLEALLYAITHDEGIVKVTGEVGSGKTMLCRVLIERLPAEVETVYLANPSLEREEILQAVLDDLKFTAPAEQRANQLLRTLQEHLIGLYGAGKRVVLLIDEAHAMPPETLEQIRLLSNLESNRHKLLQIALFGQQELDDHLGTTLLRPLRERVTHSFRLEPLVHADVGQYLMFRMRQAGYKGPDLFDQGALKLIAKSSEGLTRRLNILADKCLLAAFAEGEHGITRKHALAAISDSGFAPLGPRGAGFLPSLRKQWALMLAAVVIMAGGIGMMLYALALIRGDVVAGTKSPSAGYVAASGPLQPSDARPKAPPAVADSSATSTGAAVVAQAIGPGTQLPQVSTTVASSNSTLAEQSPKPAAPSPQPTPRVSAPFPSATTANEQLSNDGVRVATAKTPLAAGRQEKSRAIPLPEPLFSANIASKGQRPVPRPKPRYSAATRAAPARPVLQVAAPLTRTSSRPAEPASPALPELPLDGRTPSRDD